MKRIFSLLLALLMLASPFALASCGDEEEQSGTSDESKAQDAYHKGIEDFIDILG